MVFIKKTLAIVFIGFLFGIVISCSSDDPEGEPAQNSSSRLEDDEIRTLEKGNQSNYKTRALLVFTDLENWRSHYALTQGNEFDRRNAPTFNDFEEDLVVIHLGSRPNSTYQVEVVSVTYDSTDGTRQIRYREVQENAVANEALSYPYVFVRIQKAGLEYRFIKI